MKIRTLCIACVTTAAALLAGCTAVYKNTDACEQIMRSKLADVPPSYWPEASIDKLSVDHTGTGIGGSRVVVEGKLSHLQTASEVAAAAAPKGASAAKASGASAAAAAGAAAGASGAAKGNAPIEASGAASAVPAPTLASASGASAASAPSVASKPVKPKKLERVTAAECTFTGLNLASFRWLSPAELVNRNDKAASETTAE